MVQLRNMPVSRGLSTRMQSDKYESKNFLQEKNTWSQASSIAAESLQAEKLAILTESAAEPAVQTPAIDIDAPDNSDLTRSEAPRVQVNEQGQPMMYDTRTETWFPITINLPGQGAPAPAAPAVPEKEKRQQLIAIFAISLLLLLVMLYFISKKK